jgi:putative ABC transport system permease protein
MPPKLGLQNAKEAIDQPVNFDGKKIVGVVRNYNHLSLHNDIKPMLFQFRVDRLTNFMVKIRSKNITAEIVFLKKTWNGVYTNSPFSYTYLSDEFNQQYNEDKRLFRLVLLFSFISIIIAVLGLIGTCLNEAQIRTKEIGIRKVNGANVREILAMFNFDFLKWVFLSFVITTPISWYVMHRWLENFAYKTGLSWWIFALSGLLAIGIALLTVSWQSWKTATRNPVEALKYE